jgi:hypothetical protein
MMSLTPDQRAIAARMGAENRLAGIEATQKLHSWMLGTVIVLIISGFGLMLRLLLLVAENCL